LLLREHSKFFAATRTYRSLWGASFAGQLVAGLIWQKVGIAVGPDALKKTRRTMMQSESMLLLVKSAKPPADVLGSQPYLPYTTDEQRLSLFIQQEIDDLILGGRDHLVLLKFYPQHEAGPAISTRCPGLNPSGVRQEMAARIATDALAFFGPRHGGIITQQTMETVILQERTFSTPYPHITLERYDCYDAPTGEPLLGAWRACRIQNLRRETRTNRMIDMALLAIEVSKSVFPQLLT
jgi:hypothetical protein